MRVVIALVLVVIGVAGVAGLLAVLLGGRDSELTSDGAIERKYDELKAEGLAQIHRRDDYAAAERAIGAREGDGPGTIWGRGGPVFVFSCRGETL